MSLGSVWDKAVRNELFFEMVLPSSADCHMQTHNVMLVVYYTDILLWFLGVYLLDLLI